MSQSLLTRFSSLTSGRKGYLVGFFACFGLIGLALYIQQANHLEPCPLCIFQRITFMVLGVAFLIAGIHNPGVLGRKVHMLIQLVIVLTGVGIASRHIWIQTHPDEVMAECGVGVDYLFQTLPANKAIQLVFKGSGECTSIDWTLFGLTIPQLSLMAFIVLGAYAIRLFVAKRT